MIVGEPCSYEVTPQHSTDAFARFAPVAHFAYLLLPTNCELRIANCQLRRPPLAADLYPSARANFRPSLASRRHLAECRRGESGPCRGRGAFVAGFPESVRCCAVSRGVSICSVPVLGFRLRDWHRSPDSERGRPRRLATPGTRHARHAA